jgi:hypothetical protein
MESKENDETLCMEHFLTPLHIEISYILDKQ